ncbi:MAG: MATE family efflux transporter, partial [Oscillospiraceae bacterium]|nr:MATE family efflux transporter [Oscillospiraceae bacterium]
MSFLSRIITPQPELPAHRQLFSNRALATMIVPLMIEQLLQMVVGIADTLMVSYAGEATVSGVSLDTMLYTIFIYLFTAVATGGAVVVSQYLGNRDRKNADLSASQIYLIAGVVSLACMVLILLLGPTILNLLYPKVEPDVMSACRTYLWIVTLSFPANALYNAGAALYRSMGRTRTTMYVSVAMNLLNVVGNAIGIFVLHAGAAGVAWPTTISWYFAAVLMTALCLNPRAQVTLRPAMALKPDGKMIRRILHIAIPNSIENTLFQLAKVVLGSLIATFGTSQIAANGIGQTLWSLAACM